MSNIRKHNKEMGVKAGRALLQDRGGPHGVLRAASTGTDPHKWPVWSHGAGSGAYPGLRGRDLLELSTSGLRRGLCPNTCIQVVDFDHACASN